MPYRGPDAGSPPNIWYFPFFFGINVNWVGSCPILQNIISQSDPGFEIAIAIMILIENQSGKSADRFPHENRSPILISE
jgi:hypothetical protein